MSVSYTRGYRIKTWLLVGILAVLPSTGFAQSPQKAVFTVQELEALGISTIEESLELVQSVAKKQRAAKKPLLKSKGDDQSAAQELLKGLSLSDIDRIEISKDGSEVKYLISNEIQKDGVKAQFTFTIIDESLKEDRLDPIVTTPTKTPVKSSQLGEVVRVIHGEELTALNVTTVEDALNLDSNFSINVVGGVTGISTSGLKVGNVKILLNGIDLKDVSTIDGTPELSFIPVKNIERIEFLSGSNSVIYGSGTAAGVINIITKHGDDFFNVTVGERQFHNSFNSSHLVGETSVSVFGNISKNNSLSALSDTAELDQRLGQAWVLSADRKNVAGGTLEGKVSYQEGVQELDQEVFPSTLIDDPNSETRLSRVATQLAYKKSFVDGVETKLSLQHSTISRQVINEADPNNLTNTAAASYNGESTKFSIANSQKLSSSKTLFYGADAQRDSSYATGELVFGGFPSDQSYDRVGQTQAGIYGSYLGHYPWLSTHVGLRVSGFSDKISNGRIATTHLGVFRTIPGIDTKLSVNFKTGYKLPSLYQRFARATDFGAVGNESLNVERSQTKEVSLEKRLSYAKTTVSFFESNIRNLIDFNVIDPAIGYFNQGRATASGMTYSIELDAIKPMEFFKISYTSLFNRAYTRSPKFKLTASGAVRFDRLQLGSSLIYVGPTDVARYMIVDASANYDLDKNTILQSRIHNVFDADYHYDEGYQTPGRTFFLGVNRKF